MTMTTTQPPVAEQAVLRYPAEQPAEIKLRVQMSVSSTSENQAHIEPPKFRFLVSERKVLKEGADSVGSGFAMMFPGVKTPGSDIVTVTIPPLVGMIGPGQTSFCCEAVLEAVVGKRLFEAAVLHLEFVKEPEVTAVAVRQEEGDSSRDRLSSGEKVSLLESMEDVKEILFSIRSQQEQHTRAKKDTKATGGGTPIFFPEGNESHNAGASSSPDPRGKLKDRLKKMILETLEER